MELTIRYEYTTKWGIFPYWANTKYNGEDYNACGQTWGEAKERLLSKIAAVNQAIPNVPQDEVIDITSYAVKEESCHSNG